LPARRKKKEKKKKEGNRPGRGLCHPSQERGRKGKKRKKRGIFSVSINACAVRAEQRKGGGKNSSHQSSHFLTLDVLLGMEMNKGEKKGGPIRISCLTRSMMGMGNRKERRRKEGRPSQSSPRIERKLRKRKKKRKFLFLSLLEE